MQVMLEMPIDDPLDSVKEESVLTRYRGVINALVVPFKIQVDVFG